MWFAVRLYAITLAVRVGSVRGGLWFAVRLYAITLLGDKVVILASCGLRSGYMRLHFYSCSEDLDYCCGLRSGYMRLHFRNSEQQALTVVVCGQAICDYTSERIEDGLMSVVVCGQAICDYTISILA